MVYSVSPYSLYPWVKYVRIGPDCSRITTASMLECTDGHHFLVDFDERKIRNLVPIDWRVVISGEISVATVGLARKYKDSTKQRSVLINAFRCITCCLLKRGY